LLLDFALHRVGNGTIGDQLASGLDITIHHRVHFEKAPATNEQYKIYHAFLRDPNGYLLEIQRFLDADWNQ
jgi:hypothetical protein